MFPHLPVLHSALPLICASAIVKQTHLRLLDEPATDHARSCQWFLLMLASDLDPLSQCFPLLLQQRSSVEPLCAVRRVKDAGARCLAAASQSFGGLFRTHLQFFGALLSNEGLMQCCTASSARHVSCLCRHQATVVGILLLGLLCTSSAALRVSVSYELAAM